MVCKSLLRMAPSLCSKVKRHLTLTAGLVLTSATFSFLTSAVHERTLTDMTQGWISPNSACVQCLSKTNQLFRNLVPTYHHKNPFDSAIQTFKSNRTTIGFIVSGVSGGFLQVSQWSGAHLRCLLFVRTNLYILDVQVLEAYYSTKPLPDQPKNQRNSVFVVLILLCSTTNVTIMMYC